MQPQQPLFDPTFLNIEYFFDKFSNSAQPIWASITDPHMWQVIGIISTCMSILCIFIIVFSLVRMYEIQVFDKAEIEHEINEALAKEVEELMEDNKKLSKRVEELEKARKHSLINFEYFRKFFQ